ncbi:AAA family ATPase [Nonomuraea sp. NPDC048882]|uniref:AAA family ATPase n=1 Tax=Nonomuraea sp. NPDC048882 TaxID=3154347 RepID=UPI00340764B3
MGSARPPPRRHPPRRLRRRRHLSRAPSGSPRRHVQAQGPQHPTPSRQRDLLPVLPARLERGDHAHSGRGVDEHGMLNASTHAELLIVDEADRLRVAPLEQLRDHHDRTGIGLILIGMPGIEIRLSRYSRVGFIHRYKPMSANEQAFVLGRSWPHLRLDDINDYATIEAVTAITRITSGNFRLTVRLIGQIERIMKINDMFVVTKEIVDAARQNLVIGSM